MTAQPGGSNGKGDDSEADERRAAVKARLFEALSTLDRGFTASREQRAKVEKILKELIDLSPILDPTRVLLSGSTSWKLIYSDAPDIVGNGNGNGAGLSPSNGFIGAM
jgi:hypothetical protein